MKFERASGILLHPTSLPGPHGIGDLGSEAYRWIDFLSQTGCSLWQVLPLGPTGYGDSPYQCFSAFAGNPYLVSPQDLIDEGWLDPDDVLDTPAFPAERVDFGPVIQWKLAILDRAYDHFKQNATPEMCRELKDFQDANTAWLEDFALFMAIKDGHGGAPWPTWEPELRGRQPDALTSACDQLKESVERQVFRQFLFFRQWSRLRAYANNLGIQIIGDIPIFVAHDSADVWSHPELFFLNERGQPTVVAGVPPDYFSPTGQRWGNPLYNWKTHKASGYAWWLERLRAVLRQVDIIRMDHFRGFAAYWQVPGKAKTAEKGRWVKAPGKHFFSTVRQALGELPVIAEDLGVITPDVEALRDSNQLPGMKIIQFAFGGGPTDPFLPHNHTNNCVVYTGTHDNDTARGWYERVEEYERDFFRRYLGRDGNHVAWDMIRLAWSSVSIFALAPIQDLLDLGNEARMNYPGNPSGNWYWRMPADALSEALATRLKEFNYLYDRENPSAKKAG
jgi:4-alpha-glucanotransferase